MADDGSQGLPRGARPAADALARALKALKDLLGERLSVSRSMRVQYSQDHTWHDAMMPDAVAFIASEAEVSALVKICAEHKVPVIPYGVGTSLEGHIRAPFGGVTVEFSRMNEIVRVNSQDLDCTVQPGVTRKQLNTYLRDTGLFFPIDPGADASIGGMTASGASGTNAVRYGTMRENVLALRVVGADGEVMTTSRRSRKSSAGYDLTRLMVGSEGTLGLITEITLRLYGIPEAISGGVCPFASLDGACATAIEAIQMGIPVARVELLDDAHMKAINSYSKLDLPVKDTLFVEFHGSEASVREQAETFGEIARDNGALDFSWSSDPDQRSKLWEARENSFWAAMAIEPGLRGFVTDVCVPLSRLAECVLATKQDIVETGLIGPIVGHVGDGNFHVNMMVDPGDPANIAAAKAFSERLVGRALEMEGTCTGEHGVGLGKMKYLEEEHGPATLDAMRAIKRALDPGNILNPGKIVQL